MVSYGLLCFAGFSVLVQVLLFYVVLIVLYCVIFCFLCLFVKYVWFWLVDFPNKLHFYFQRPNSFYFFHHFLSDNHILGLTLSHDPWVSYTFLPGCELVTMAVVACLDVYSEIDKEDLLLCYFHTFMARDGGLRVVCTSWGMLCFHMQEQGIDHVLGWSRWLRLVTVNALVFAL